MLKEVEILICLIFLLLSIIFIFNARNIVRKKIDGEFENSKVLAIKITGLIVCLLSLFAIYYINRL